MNTPVSPLEQTFLDLIAIDEVHPHEDQVLTYISRRLTAAGLTPQRDKIGNIVALIPGGAGDTIGLVAHTDIAAPLNGRQVIIDDDVIKTDETGLLGGDDKAAVAVLIELADDVKSGKTKSSRPIELLFTVGEEAGCMGAMALDDSFITAKSALVLDWSGPINAIVTKSPAYLKINVEFIGRTAHPAEWQDGRNAGAALIEAAGKITQGEYSPGVTSNIGLFEFGQARNQIAGSASLQGELRSYDTAKVDAAAAEIKQIFEESAKKHQVEARLSFTRESPAYELDQQSATFKTVVETLSSLDLAPKLQSTYGCFDGNVLAGRGIEVMMLGAGYYNPHSPGEYVKRSEFAVVLQFVQKFVAK